MSKKYIRALIVDDESHARLLIRNVLDLFDNPIEIIGEASNLPEAVRMIQKLEPALLFLDINMPNHSGLELSKFLDENHQIIIVFVTAHNEYAIEAIRASAFDYLLKPINLKQLQQCVGRIEKEYLKRKESNNTRDEEMSIEISTNRQKQYLKISEILYIHASAMYATIHTTTKQFLVSKPLKSYLFLESIGFYRIHRSYLVNTSKIKNLTNSKGSKVTLENGESLPVSRGLKEKFKAFMNEKLLGKH